MVCDSVEGLKECCSYVLLLHNLLDNEVRRISRNKNEFTVRRVDFLELLSGLRVDSNKSVFESSSLGLHLNNIRDLRMDESVASVHDTK